MKRLSFIHFQKHLFYSLFLFFITQLSSYGQSPYSPSYTTANTARRLASGDFNNDGHKDLAVLNDATQVEILLGNSDRTFTSSGTYALSSTGKIGCHDINHDSKDDLYIITSSGLDVYINDGSAQFPSRTTVVNAPASGTVTQVIAGHYNADSNLDVAFLMYLGYNSGTSSDEYYFSVFTSDASGNFTQATGQSATPYAGMGVQSYTGGVAADMDQDGIDELIFFKTNQVWAFKTGTDLEFTETSGLGYGWIVGTVNLTDAVVGNFDGNSTLDVALLSPGNGIALFLGSKPFFTPQYDYKGFVTSMSDPVGISATDVNGDGLHDLVHTSSSQSKIQVHYAKAGGITYISDFGIPTSINMSHPGGCLTVNDFTNDGNTDIAVALNTGNKVALFTRFTNAAPTSSDTSKSITVNTIHTFAIADFPFSDSDGDTFQSVKIKSLPANGTLKDYFGNIFANNLINKAVISAGDFTFTPATDFTGSTSFTFEVFDGLALSSTYTFTFNVTSGTNSNPPTAQDFSITIDEDTEHTFAAGEFNFNDADGNSFAALIIESLPDKGQLKVNNSSVTAGQSIDYADIPNLTYLPSTNENGAGYTSVTFKVSDGTHTSSSANTITINVTAINDAPTGSDKTITISLAGDTYTFASADFGFDDVDGNSFSSLQVLSLPASGILKVNGISVNANDIILFADLTDLTFESDAAFTGSASFTFKVSDGSLFSASPNTITLNIVALPTFVHKAQHESFLISPNPGKGVYTIEFSDEENVLLRYEVFTANGKSVSGGTSFLSGKQLRLDITDLPAGKYTVKVDGLNKQYFVRLLKE